MTDQRYNGTTQHAACSPSSAAQWMNCPASITLAEGRTRPSSRYAREGTAAHQIAEMIIGGNMFPPGKITVEGEQFIVGIPMLRALNPYIDYVQRLQPFTKDLFVEAKVKLKGAGGLLWGTADCVAKTGTVLHVCDLKYGKGVPVDPDCAQLKIYALAAMDTFWPFDIDTIRMTIIQPRLDPTPKTHTMSVYELVRWHVNELSPALIRILKGDVTEKTGPYCRWCVRKAECTAFRSYKFNQAADIFDDGIDTLNS